MPEKEKPTCPHCGARLLKWKVPDNSTWDVDYQYACFNDDCPYYQRGWDWMMKNFKAHASYRYRYNPATGESGPLAVWSKTAIKDFIVDENEN